MSPDIYGPGDNDYGRKPLTIPDRFPSEVTGFPGSLRDWFAGMASESDACLPTRAEEVAEMLGLTRNEYCKDVCGNYRRALAICKYKYADAMLTERNKSDE